MTEGFWRKVDIGLCWEWTGALRNGYGLYRTGRTITQAHRFAWELLVTPIPDGHQLDHLCRNRRCVNPDHLEPVTNAENASRGIVGERNRRKTHCPQGHLYDEANTYHYRGKRGCRSCRAASTRSHLKRKDRS